MFHFMMPLLLFFFGYLVKYKELDWMIAGYNTSSKKEKEKYDLKALCNGIGNFMFLLGLSMFIPTVGITDSINWLFRLGWALFIFAVVIFLICANTGNRYKK